MVMQASLFQTLDTAYGGGIQFVAKLQQRKTTCM